MQFVIQFYQDKREVAIWAQPDKGIERHFMNLDMYSYIDTNEKKCRNAYESALEQMGFVIERWTRADWGFQAKANHYGIQP